MNLNQKVLALMVALAAGVAGAAGTTAGTVINNQATATYTDPTTNAAVVTPAVSNIVSTTVTPVPSFTVLSTVGSLNDTGGQNNPVAGYDRTGVLPGSQQVFAYTVKNTGNTPVTVNMTTQLRTDNAVTGVAYYLDVNGNGTLDAGDTLLTDTNGDTTVDTASIAPDASVKLLQVYTVPTTAVGGTYYGADPVGNAKYDANYAPGNATPTTTSTTTVTGSDTDNFNRVLVYTPSVTSGSIDDNGPGGTTPTTPPATGTTDGVTPPSSKPTPGGPNPAYADPSNPATVIAVVANVQYAYPLADAEKVTDDKVTFVNSLTNGGTATDSFFLYPPTGLPAGTVVTYLDSAGNALPVVNNPADGKSYPQLTNVPSGTTVNFRVVVTYPDTDGTTPPPGTITINVPIDSASDSDAAPNTTATDIIYAPVLQFGDSTPGTQGTSPTPAPNQLVSPGTPTGLTTATSTDSTAIFPMDLANVGGYAETYKLAGSVTVPVTGGGAPVVVAVRYYTGTATNPTTLLTTDASGNYISPSVVPGTEQLVYAVIDIPANAAATFTNGTTNPLLVSQQATGSTSGIIRNDNNDTISVAAVGGANPSKTVDKATAKPGEDLTYTIIGKNGFNTPLLNYVIKEADGTGTGTGASTSPKANIFANSVFKTVGVTVSGATGTVLYRFNGGAWQTSAVPTIALNTVTSVETGLDTNADTSITGADSLPVGGQLTETLVMTLK
ncbi:hypothetical protein [Deinococcus sp. UYEF24]